MSQRAAFIQLREQAIALRRAGRSRREIKELLAVTSNETLNEALKGEPPQPWTWRPNAKDDLRAKARELREQGCKYHQIAAELGVSKSSVSLWVRDLPRPPRLSYTECRQRAAEGVCRYWAAERLVREAEREAVAAGAAAQIGELSDREILIAGAVRKNTGENYHGCLRIEVRRSVRLYPQIEGWASAATAARSVS